MNIEELVNYTENNTDEIIKSSMLKDQTYTLNKFIINIISDLINGVNLSD